MRYIDPRQPPAGAYCDCCHRFSDSCICLAEAAKYYGGECQTCLPITEPEKETKAEIEKSIRNL